MAFLLLLLAASSSREIDVVPRGCLMSLRRALLYSRALPQFSGRNIYSVAPRRNNPLIEGGNSVVRRIEWSSSVVDAGLTAKQV